MKYIYLSNRCRNGIIKALREEERLSKIRAKELFDLSIWDGFEVGTFKGLSQIHEYLFQDTYGNAGEIRNFHIVKNSCRFLDYKFIESEVTLISMLNHKNYYGIIYKFVEMNYAHPFRQGNGRCIRIWLDMMLKKELGQVVDWGSLDKDDFINAIQRSPINSLEIYNLLEKHLTDKIADRDLFLSGIDASYYLDGYYAYNTEDL